MKRKLRVGANERQMDFFFLKPRKISNCSTEEVYKNVAESLANEVYSLKKKKLRTCPTKWKWNYSNGS